MTEEQIAEQYKKVTKTFKFPAVQNGVAANTKFELDKNAQMVTGFHIGGTSPSLLNFRGSLGLRIGGDVLLENDTPVQLFVSSTSVPVAGRIWKLGEIRPGNYIVEATYTDEDNAAAPWAAYTVFLTVEYLLPKKV